MLKHKVELLKPEKQGKEEKQASFQSGQTSINTDSKGEML